MTAKEYLNELSKLRCDLKIDRTLLQNISIDHNTIHGIDYAADKVQTSPKNALEEAAWKMLEQKEKLQKEILHLEAEINRRLSMIKNMSSYIYSEMLYKKFWEGKEGKQIAAEMDMAVSYTH